MFSSASKFSALQLEIKKGINEIVEKSSVRIVVLRIQLNELKILTVDSDEDFVLKLLFQETHNLTKLQKNVENLKRKILFYLKKYLSTIFYELKKANDCYQWIEYQEKKWKKIEEKVCSWRFIVFVEARMDVIPEVKS
ncbi:CLUMA_CG002990, isoform A [Clunio marinus]|uniref:CLUMA_CG002990, isoform A n=1 Tax=Clunio marinus TaxID=568069 RepID=A0A1J1HMF2_9DIPT|nr:CLUMA_CG002990, isoform A [Clunio marinus]